MTKTAIAALAALIFVPVSAAADDNLTGQASVIDGDTLEIHGTRIRLWGIDAPESGQLSVEARIACSITAESGERPRRLHGRTDGELHPDLFGPIRADRGLMFGW
jgi:endonuclease YncB( thermonuclease family)